MSSLQQVIAELEALAKPNSGDKATSVAQIKSEIVPLLETLKEIVYGSGELAHKQELEFLVNKAIIIANDSSKKPVLRWVNLYNKNDRDRIQELMYFNWKRPDTLDYSEVLTSYINALKEAWKTYLEYHEAP